MNTTVKTVVALPAGYDELGCQVSLLRYRGQIIFRIGRESGCRVRDIEEYRELLRIVKTAAVFRGDNEASGRIIQHLEARRRAVESG